MDDPRECNPLTGKKGSKNEPLRPVKKNGDDVDNDDDQKSLGVEDEEALFVAMEKDEESRDARLPHSQPKDVKAAPKLLQSAIEQGEVKPDDSESDSEQQDATKTDAEPHHAHARVRNIPNHYHKCIYSVCINIFLTCIWIPQHRPINWNFFSIKRRNTLILSPKIWRICKQR